MKDLSKLKPLPEHGSCFVCGTENPKSIGVKWYYDDNDEIFGEVILTKEQQGPPNYAHGGASAALLDEAMGFAGWVSGHQIVSVNLNINFMKPVPLGVKIQVHGKIVKTDGKKIYTKGEIIFENGEVAVEGSAILVEPSGFFDKKVKEFHEAASKKKNMDKE